MFEKFYKIVYTDKFQHGLFLYAGCLSVYAICKSRLISATVALFIGILKEICDKIVKKQDWKENSRDMMSDIIGIGLALLVISIGLLRA